MYNTILIKYNLKDDTYLIHYIAGFDLTFKHSDICVVRFN
jgi:hypothetical protein